MPTWAIFCNSKQYITLNFSNLYLWNKLSQWQILTRNRTADIFCLFVSGFFLPLDSELSSGLPEDSYSSGGEALDGDDEDESGNVVEEATSSKADPGAGWADAMAKVLNKKIPQNKSTILAKNKKLEKERQKEKQERLEKRIKVRKGCSMLYSQMVGMHARSPQWGLGRVLRAVSALKSLLHHVVASIYFYFADSNAVGLFPLSAFSRPSGRLIFGSRTVLVCQIKVILLLWESKQLL